MTKTTTITVWMGEQGDTGADHEVTDSDWSAYRQAIETYLGEKCPEAEIDVCDGRRPNAPLGTQAEATVGGRDDERLAEEAAEYVQDVWNAGEFWPRDE